MSDLPQQNTIVQYVADGITTQYVVPFYTPIEVDGTPDLDVFTQAAASPPVPATDINEWNVAYTYTPNIPDPTTGGNITFLGGHIPPSGYIVTIVRNVSASLDVEFANAVNFSGITLDAALDKLLLISQQNKSYTLERNLSYIINSYLPDSTIAANVQIPVLAAGQVWYGSSNGVIAATLEQSADTSTLRSELANEQPVTNGAALVGYYDTYNMVPTTVAAQLALLTTAVDQALPAGSGIKFYGTVAPTGYLLCDGSTYATATYPALFAAIGYLWGGSGANFKVPDTRRRVAMGVGGSGTATIGNVVGNTGGSETEALTDISQIPAHTHTYLQTTLPGIGATSGGAANLVNPQSAASTGSTGAATPSPFNIVQSAYIVTEIIKT